MTHDITEPLQLAKGSHKAGSGKGCAMNVISWENGDVKITDYPSCSDPFLATLVQILNDNLADPDTGLLSPEDSMRVLDLGHQTVGTTSHGFDTIKMLSMYEMLISRYMSEGDLSYIKILHDMKYQYTDTPNHPYRSKPEREFGSTAAWYVASAIRNRVAGLYLSELYTPASCNEFFIEVLEKEIKTIFAEFKRYAGIETKQIPVEVTQEAVSKMLACTV